MNTGQNYNVGANNAQNPSQTVTTPDEQRFDDAERGYSQEAEKIVSAARELVTYRTQWQAAEAVNFLLRHYLTSNRPNLADEGSAQLVAVSLELVDFLNQATLSDTAMVAYKGEMLEASKGKGVVSE